METIEPAFVRVRDRAFIFGGCHGNLQATQATLERATELDFQADQIICTGDVVAYCANPQETVDAIREAEVTVLMGNCEEALGFNLDSCGCGFDQDTACDLLSQQWFAFCQANLDREARTWMASLPRILILEIAGFRFLIAHGSPERINQFIFASDISSGQFRLKVPKNIDGVIAGHSGIPFIAQTDELLWLNSGAVGMPANDGTPRLWYATIETTGEFLRIETHALDYDHERAAHAMHTYGLNNGYADCLSSGIWPSHDVLPETERGQTGIPLVPQSMMVSRDRTKREA